MPSLINVPVDALTATLLRSYFLPREPSCNPLAADTPVPMDDPLLRGLYLLALDHIPFKQPTQHDTRDKKKVIIAMVVPPGLADYGLQKRHLGRLGAVLDQYVYDRMLDFMVGLALYTSPHAAANHFIAIHQLGDAQKTEDRLVKAVTRAYNKLPGKVLARVGDYVL